MIRSLIKRLRIPLRGNGPAKDQLHELYVDDALRITTLGDPEAPNLFLCFTGIRQAMGGIGAEEFVGSTSLPGYSAIFITDLERTWFNGFDPADLQAILADRTQGRRIVTIGNSMGGYGAVWATKYFNVATAIAFAPQFSVHPEVVPTEKRWMEFRKDIYNWRDRSLAGSFNEQTQYFTINGDLDELHWSSFPRTDNCEHILIENSAHNPASVLKECGVLNDLLDRCIRGFSPYPLLQERGVKGRQI